MKGLGMLLATTLFGGGTGARMTGKRQLDNWLSIWKQMNGSKGKPE
jgi:hypothetical protein